MKSQMISFFENSVPGQNTHLLRKLSASFFSNNENYVTDCAFSFALAFRELRDRWEQQLLAQLPGF